MGEPTVSTSARGARSQHGCSASMSVCVWSRLPTSCAAPRPHPRVAKAIGDAAFELGWDCDEVPMADGGEGTLEALGGPNRTTTVTGPLGAPVEAAWRLDGRTAVIEMAAASGLALVGGSEANDPVAASTVGTGELVVAALDAGARRVIVGLGGSATTDGGLGALRALHPIGRLKGIELVVACDSRVPFLDAARSSRRRREPRPRRSSSCDGASSAWPRCTWTSTASTCSPWRGPGPPGGSPAAWPRPAGSW